MRMMNLPKVTWAIFQDNKVLGMYYRCECGCKNITLDAIKLQSFLRRFLCLTHETIHSIFDACLPCPLDIFCDRMLDITDGNSPELIYEKDREDFLVLYEWE